MEETGVKLKSSTENQDVVVPLNDNNGASDLPTAEFNVETEADRRLTRQKARKKAAKKKECAIIWFIVAFVLITLKFCLRMFSY